MSRVYVACKILINPIIYPPRICLAELAALEKELAASLEQETGGGVGDAVAPGDGDVAAISQEPDGAEAAKVDFPYPFPSVLLG